ncbi:MAG: hypothetical protein AAGJ95_11820 [Cyanobacteria bacterium J06554_11]
MIRLYRGADTSPLLHPIDAQSWRSLGWTDSPAEPAKVGTEPPPPEQHTLTDKEDREAELMAMSWREIKDIAEQLGIEKHENGWEETIPAILEAEF